MKFIKTLGVLFILFVLYVFFAGVRLTVENQSGKEIHNVEIAYGKGTFFADSISDKEKRKKFLGKIGEGAKFDIKWRDNSGKIFKAQLSVYLHGHFDYDRISIKILPRGKAILLYKGEEDNSIIVSDRST